jgi:hypothetical protein
MLPSDWARFAFNLSGNLGTNLRALRFRETHRELWEWLRAETAARTAEAQRAGLTALDAGSLFTKHVT